MRAHELYLARGCGPGDALGDWLKAETELWGNYERLHALVTGRCPRPARGASTK